MTWNIVLTSDKTAAVLRATGTTLLKTPTEPTQSHWFLDLQVVSHDEAAKSSEETSFPVDLHDAVIHTAARELLERAIKDASSSNSENGRQPVILRLAFSQSAGIVVRPDFLTYRLHDYEDVALALGFLEPLSPAVAISADQAAGIKTSQDFLALLQTALGGVVAQLRPSEDSIHALRTRLDDEFAKRLSIPWTVNESLTPQRVFWVQGRANIEASQQFYQAASALGITLVVLDEPGHWLEDDAGPHAHYREAFIPISIDGDEGLTQRIVDAVKAYPHKVDGIVSISDVRLPLVARACEILGLPTSPSAAYKLAGDKGATREIEAAADQDEGFVLKTVEDLNPILAKRRDQLRYPLIVKPCTGWNSDCVVKVRDEDELRAAVHRASARHAGSAASSTGVVIEPYVDGPEVDANFVMLDGEVLFCDVTDDFPCSGDLPGTEGTKAANFMETLMDVPSALPKDEKAMMQDSLQKSIMRLGFQSGVFHCEARVRGSQAHYVVDPETGILDLQHDPRNGHGTGTPPSCFLHEVNARTPGYINCVAALLAHGVDYYAIRLLLSLGPRENARIRALAQPFLHGKPQYVLGIAVLPPTRAGIMGSEDAVLEFLEANPALRRHVVHFQTIKKRGDIVQGPDSSELWCVAYVIVASRKGREECLSLVNEVREKFDYRLMDE